MESGKILKSLALCLSAWIGIVFVLLSIHADLNYKATATPLTADIAENIHFNDPETTKADVLEQDFQPVEIKAPLVQYKKITGILSKGESFDLAMKRLNVPDPVRSNIIKGFDKSLDFRMLQPGDRFTIAFDREDSIDHAVYESGLLSTYILKRNDKGHWDSARQAVPLEYRVEKLSGSISTSLYAAFIKLDEEPKLIHAYADIFASKIDFNTETRTGDMFELLVEKYYKDDVFVGYGHILAASYQKQGYRFLGYHYASENTPAGYFDHEGQALGTWFIRSPIPFGRVTSRFTMRRKHPIDGVVRPHLGIDLAAPRGTPVMATAEGRVEFIGRKGGFGKTVILKHHGGYKTYYGHLHNYKKGLRKGSSVQQKDIIGYVGSTGISTGPHLDYRIQLNGIFRNPFGIKFKAKTVLQNEELELFLQQSDRIAKLFDSKTEGKILQVKQITLTDEKNISFL